MKARRISWFQDEHVSVVRALSRPLHRKNAANISGRLPHAVRSRDEKQVDVPTEGHFPLHDAVHRHHLLLVQLPRSVRRAELTLALYTNADAGLLAGRLRRIESDERNHNDCTLYCSMRPTYFRPPGSQCYTVDAIQWSDEDHRFKKCTMPWTWGWLHWPKKKPNTKREKPKEKNIRNISTENKAREKKLRAKTTGKKTHTKRVF